MNESSLLPDDEPVSMPSERTMRMEGESILGRIDHYELLRKLGGGGFGVVYLARDTASGVEVALKTLHPLLKRSAEEMDLLREKFALVSRLSHPNIATALVLHPCRDVGIWDEPSRREMKLSAGDSVMVMRYAPGATLSKWRRQFPGGVVPFGLALEVGRQVASALDYAHSERIVHRDVKPSNVMVETVMPPPAASQVAGPTSQVRPATCDLGRATRIRVRILDFGLAAEIRSSMSRVSTEQGDTSGTRPYMAPEQWMGRKQDGRTDQYALACVLYELLSGAPPFAGVFETGDPVIMRTAVLSDPPEGIEDLSPSANAALLRALAKEPKDRFPSCVAFVSALSSTTERMEGRDASTPRPTFGRAEDAFRPGKGDLEEKGASVESRDAATLEAEALRRKVALARSLAAVSKEDRADAVFASFVSTAETELAVSEEAFRFGRIAAAVACLDRADAAMKRFDEERNRRDREVAVRTAFIRVLLRRVEAETRKVAPFEARISRRVVRAAGVSFALLKIPPNGARPAFWMGETPVTQKLWTAVMGSNPSKFQGDDRRPVEMVSWDDCQDFLKRLNACSETVASGLVFRLPTEGEWEFACRAGAKESYCRLSDGTGITENTLDRVAWFDGNSGAETHPVGAKESNAWGLYDMHGNVFEWTSTAAGDFRIRRGGCWFSSAAGCESSVRIGDSPSFRNDPVGFRLAADG